MGIGKRIREARELRGLTQKELSELCSVTSSAIANYESDTSHPKESILYKLMDVLHVDANFLFQDYISCNKISGKEMDIICAYRSADESDKIAIDAILSKYKKAADSKERAV